MGQPLFVATVARALGAAALVGLSAGEVADWRARRPRRRGQQPTSRAGGVVLVLGCPGNNAVQRAVQRWRVDMALRAFRRYRCDTVVFSGDTPYSTRSEAAQMAELARGRGLADEHIVLEERARTTRDNVALSRPLVADAAFVVLVSDGMHARRAHRLWVAEHGEGAPVALVDDGYRPLDRTWAKLPCMCAELLVGTRAVVGLRRWRSG